jgi:hypothetical protein
MAVIDGVGLAEPSTITKSLAAVPITRNSSVTYQEVMTLGSPNSTSLLALAEVMGSAPASTTVGLVVRPVGPVSVYQSTAADLNVTVAGYSTTVNVSSLAGAVNMRSSAANALVSVYQSTAADLLATITPAAGSTFRVQPGSTAWATSAGFHFNSSGDLKVEASFTGSTTVTVARMVGNSSAGDYMPVRIVNSSADGFSALAADYVHDSTLTASTVSGPAVILRASAAAPTDVGGDDRFVAQWALRSGAAVSALTGTAGALVASATAQPSTAAVGLVTRPVIGGLQTYAASTTGQATGTSIVSSAAGSKAFVYAYSITSTASTGNVAGGFFDGATLKWPITLSSGFSGANLAVSPPAYLFSGSTGAALTFNVASTVTGGMNVGVAYWLST